MILDKHGSNISYARRTPDGWEIVDLETGDVIESSFNLDRIVGRAHSAGYAVYRTRNNALDNVAKTIPN